MRVLHVYSGNLYGGIETMLVTLARRRHHCPSLQPEFALCFDGRLASELQAAGAIVHQLGRVRFTRPASALAARSRLKDILDAHRFDGVITHGAWIHALLGGAVCSTGVPLAFWAHDALRARHWTERLARRTPPALTIANSRFTQGTVSALFAGVPSTVIHPPVDLEAATAPARADERAALRASLETNPTDLVIVQASRNDPWKGHRVLLDALGQLRGRAGWVAWIAGGPQRRAEVEYLARLRRQAEDCGVADRVRWLGERTDVPALLAAADVYCQPNELPEPFGVVFVEALAAGLPVVTSAFGGAAEIVDPTCGVLVPPRDAHALAGALERVLDDADFRVRASRVGPPRALTLCEPGQQLHRLHAALSGRLVSQAVSA
jgi:glycosyltransferase involved in cell wall biosynthesis